jgi:hypothetical protein
MQVDHFQDFPLTLRLDLGEGVLVLAEVPVPPVDPKTDLIILQLVAALVVLDGIRYYHHLPMELLVQLLDIDILLEEADLAAVHLLQDQVRQ